MTFLIVLTSLFLLASCDSKKNADSDGSFKVELVDLEGVKEEKTIAFKTGDSLVVLLDENFDNFVVEGTALMSIGNLYTAKDWNPYIAIYVDGQYGSVGIKEQSIYDGMILTLKMETF